MRQLLTEGLLLSAAGGAAGLAVAWLALQWMRTSGPADLPRMDEVVLDGRVLGLALAITFVTGVAFALLPALRLTRREDHEELRGGARLSGPAGHRRLRRVLVGGQVALALVLLVGSGLLLRSFVAMTQVDPGFRAADLVTASLPMAGREVRGFDPRAPFPGRAARAGGGLAAGGIGGTHLRALAGRWRVGEVDHLRRPATAGLARSGPGGLVPPRESRLLPHPGRAPGRRPGLRARRPSSSPPVAVVNEAMARRFWPGEDPIGKLMWMGRRSTCRLAALRGLPLSPAHRRRRGGDERLDALDAPPKPEVYQLYGQSGEISSSLYLAVRSAREPTALIADLRGALRQVDPTLPLAQIATAGDLVRESRRKRRFGALLVTGFAGLALTLRSWGDTAGRAVRGPAPRELAIRLALGAADASVVRLVLREGLVTALTGATAGLAPPSRSAGSRDVISR